METLLLLYLLGLALAAAAAYFFFGSFVLGAGYQPTPARVARRMVELAQVGPHDEVLDLGAGTGGLVFLCAAQGADVTGVEVEPLRFLFLRLRRSLSPYRARVRIVRDNMFRTDLRRATVVVVFLWPGAMERLKPKFETELPPGARVVSYWHPVPGWTPDREDPPLRVYLYVKKEAPVTGEN